MDLRRMKDYSRSCEGARKVDTSRKEVITKMRDMHAVHALPESKRKRLKQGSSDRKKAEAAKKEEKDKKLYKKVEWKKERLDAKEKKLDEDVHKGNEEFLLAQEFLRTASSSLSEAIKEENMTRIAVASELMSAAQKKI